MLPLKAVGHYTSARRAFRSCRRHSSGELYSYRYCGHPGWRRNLTGLALPLLLAIWRMEDKFTCATTRFPRIRRDRPMASLGLQAGTHDVVHRGATFPGKLDDSD